MASLAIYFHGASNDKSDDPDNKKLRTPSAEHPFFVSPDPGIAARYARTPTDKNGRLADIEKSQEKALDSSRVYLIRIDKEKLKTFDIFTRRDIQKLAKFYSKEALDELEKLFVYDDYTIMRLTIMLANCLKGSGVTNKLFNAVFDVVGQDEDSYQKVLVEGLTSDQKKQLIDYYKNVSKIPMPVYMFFFLDILKYLLEAKLIDKSFFTRDYKTHSTMYFKNKDLSRRDIKKILFKQIQELGFNTIVERNTFGHSKTKNELALLEMSPVIDAYPKAIRLDDLENAMDYAYDQIAVKKAEKKDFLKLLLSQV